MTNSILPDPRDREIKKAQEERMVRDTIILQKVNKVNREAFTKRFPGQIEHCMRLTAERLQAVLTNKPSDLTNIDTWSSSPTEINQLTQALYNLSLINNSYPVLTEED
jgi:hypothetical protein